jgi:hypothetical protein
MEPSDEGHKKPLVNEKELKAKWDELCKTGRNRKKLTILKDDNNIRELLKSCADWNVKTYTVYGKPVEYREINIDKTSVISLEEVCRCLSSVYNADYDVDSEPIKSAPPKTKTLVWNENSKYHNTSKKDIEKYILSLGFIKKKGYIPQWSDHANLIYIKPLRVDWYIVEYSLMIEFDGMQHFSDGGDHMNKDLFTRFRRDYCKDFYSTNFNKNILRLPANMPLEICCEWIDKALSMIKKGVRVHFSYRHFINKLMYEKLLTDIYWEIVPSPTLDWEPSNVGNFLKND